MFGPPPGGGGKARDLAATLRELAPTGDRPRWICLADAGDMGARLVALRGGADEFLAKPVVADLLVETVRRRVEAARTLRDRHAGTVPRDPVTGLWGHGYLLQRIDRAILDGAAQDPDQGVIYIDIDPNAGLDALRRAGALDAVLAQVGQAPRAALGPNDVAARLGERSLAVPVLAEFPWALVRLSRDAVTRMDGPSLTTLVAAVHQSGAQVAAAGIEDPQAIARVWGCGVDYIQGHFVQAVSADLDFDFAGTELL